ncbi:MraZ protein [Fusobacterium naviforme]|uniref:Transcriptional regulator MraZ n=1 Tax=Moryella indoligenes TaxID=371674 RepID=A0AAE4AKF4_9FIRM|nr:division/cell wall cluster transcriptional repressor MraZ [Moryella indoligenes]KAB0578799.1 division/cell wall cluster transcriptional repressor MraZ [Fusobacterium naviforme]MDQ0151945.1 MraZ protein [Moryella indoligenes]PSL11572.1 MraZ protein [Fusobacterium naviforme]STO26654.1 cell division protein MraZ [Fusobacterium naviforme]
MFTGEYNHTVDTKGRLIVPSLYREQLGASFVVTKGLDGCLFVYSAEEWNKLEEKLANLPLTNQSARKFSRFLHAGAVFCETDKQGRILLPANLREFSGIVKEAVLIGNGNHVEIWSAENWAKELEIENNADDIAAGLDGLGFGI